jgi:hypothetical protein
MMRRNSSIIWLVSVILIGLLQPGVAATDDSPWQNGFRFAVRIGGGAAGVLVYSGHAKLEGALGYGDTSLTGYVGLPFLPQLDSVLGGELILSREWLSASLALDYDTALRKSTVSFTGNASPPSWPILADADAPVLFCGITATSTVTSRSQGNEIVLSPYLLGLLSVWEMGVSSNLGLDVHVAAETVYLVSDVVISISMPRATLTTTAEFKGGFEEPTALRISLELQELGLTVAGAILPSNSGYTYELSASCLFGDTDLLSRSPGTNGLICIGDTCYSL